MRRIIPTVASRRRLKVAVRSARREMWFYIMATIVFAVAFLLLGWMIATQDAHAAPTTGSAKTLRVCASPNDLPFSNKDRKGFENKLASLAAKALGEPVKYEWRQGAGLQRGLDTHECDAIMGWPTKARGLLTTKPYYRSTYVLVYRQSAPYKIRSLKDPILKKLAIGVREIGDKWTSLPGGAMLAKHDLQGSARPYPLRDDAGHSPSMDLIKAVADGDLDAAIVWGPPAGYFARRQSVKLAVLPLTQVRLRVPTRFSISMAVRKDDTALRTKLDRFLERHHGRIRALLEKYNVPLLPLDGASDQSAAAVQ